MKFDFLNGTSGEQSSKRLFAFIIIILWVVYFFANLFFGKVLKETLEDNLFYMMLIFFTGVSTEKLINNVAKKIEAQKDGKGDTVVITDKVEQVN